MERWCSWGMLNILRVDNIIGDGQNVMEHSRPESSHSYDRLSFGEQIIAVITFYAIFYRI